ncbi:MAG: TlpA family protein disulfide reductase [Chitinophagaceae bacterium]|nr:TlpA family protein disulfide reductase [Chitinophagaceae bacterium]
MKKNSYLTTLLFLFIPLFQPDLPDMSLKSTEGKTYDLKKDFAEKDKLYVFSFWATWCVPCIRELDEISDVYDEWQKEVNMELVAISVDDTRTEKRVKPLVSGKEWPYKILYDTNQELKRRLGISDMPYVIVVKNGKIIHSHSGYTPGSETDFFEELKKM